MLLLTQSFNLIGGRKYADSERIVHLMEVLIATLLSCSSAKGIIDKIPPSAEFRSEIVETIQSGTEEGCEWDAKAD